MRTFLLLLTFVAVLALSPAAIAADAAKVPRNATASTQAAKKVRKQRRDHGARSAIRARGTRSALREREAKGPLESLSPLTVGTLTCVVPASVSLAGLAVGDLVELKCDLVGTTWTLRKIEREDDEHSATAHDENDDRSGSAGDDDDEDGDHEHSHSNGGEHDDDD